MRTKKTAKNLIISTILTTIIALIGLVKTKVFLNYLGDEATGIYQLFSQILSYISLVDAGLTSSILYSLYKPVSDNNIEKINSILKGGRNFYNKIALIIIVIGIIVSFKIDFFLSDYTMSLWYVQVCFILFIVASSINYFVTPQKVILEARQNLYKVHTIVYVSMIVKAILEIVLLLLGLNLLSLMILFIIISLIQNFIIMIVAKKDYKQLSYREVEPDNSFKKETKNLVAQKVASIIFNNIDVVLISKFISSSSVVIYTSYMYIINSLQNVLRKIGSSSLASVGNLLVSEKEKARDIFYEYNSLCYYIANVVCIPVLLVITSFVSIFYGETYTLSYLGSLLVVIILYFKIIEIPFDVYNSALGYFSKIKKCLIFQSIVNLVLSIVLLFSLGIEGILLATVISYIVGVFAIYPKILNDNYFKEHKIRYYLNSLKLCIISIVSYLIIYFVIKNIEISNLFSWFVLGICCFVVNFIFVTLYYILIRETKFFDRIKNLIKERRRK
ncbi:MAG: polysaccharide biosynthesis protein [Bacilli bacterium]|nr:polysaccharide biosynthesis protein [Bacilli bacterium]